MLFSSTINSFSSLFYFHSDVPNALIFRDRPMLRIELQLMHGVGAKRLVVVGVPPIGCMPLVRTMMGQTTCVESYNKVVVSFNSKVQKRLETIKAALRMKIAFVDVYGVLQKAVSHPMLYGN